MSIRTRRAAARNFPIRRVLFWLTMVTVVVGSIASIAFANRSVAPIASVAPPFNLLAAGDVAPPFSAATTQGAFSLADAHKPVLLEVFATWCPHCQHETSVLNALYAKYKDRFDFVAVSGSPYAHDRTAPESQEDVLEFAQYFHVRYPIAFDSSLAVANNYLQGGYPTIVIIGTDKDVAYVGSGEIAESTLEREISHMLAKR